VFIITKQLCKSTLKHFVHQLLVFKNVTIINRKYNNNKNYRHFNLISIMFVYYNEYIHESHYVI